MKNNYLQDDIYTYRTRREAAQLQTLKSIKVIMSYIEYIIMSKIVCMVKYIYIKFIYLIIYNLLFVYTMHKI